MTIRQLIDELSGLIDRGVSENREVIYFYDDDAYTYQAGIDEVYADEDRVIISGELSQYGSDINKIQG